MAQQFPTSAQVIYDVLSGDATFTALLGNYTFNSNTASTATALSIVSAGQDMPALRNVSGVECIIQDAGNITSRERLTGGVELVTLWSVFLVAWEPSNGADLHAAAMRICELFVGAQAIQTVATADGLGSLVQTKVQIESDKPIRG